MRRQARQELDQRPGGVGLRAPAGMPAANTVISWISGGSGPTIVDAGNGQQLAHLLEADLGFAAGNDLRRRARPRPA